MSIFAVFINKAIQIGTHNRMEQIKKARFLLVLKNSKYFFATLILVFMTITGQAQTNPHKGYIITNDGDTIQGTIDYRSDTQNGQKCVFRKDGEQEYKTYNPQQLKGYRLKENGVYYVTRTLPIDSVEQLVFAEFLIKGGLSLYHYKTEGLDYFFFEDSDGKLAVLKNEEFVTSYWASENRQNRRKILHDAAEMLKKSEKAKSRLWAERTTSQNLSSIVKEYNEEYCTELGECTQFEYSAKVANYLPTRFFVVAELFMGELSPHPFSDMYETLTYQMTVPRIGVGLDVGIPRLVKNLSIQSCLLFSKWDMSKEYTALQHECSLKYYNAQLDAGLSWHFLGGNSFKPFLRAGGMAAYLFDVSSENMSAFQYGNMDENGGCFGYYAGAGFDWQLGNHTLRLAANYEAAKVTLCESKTKAFTLHAAFIF